MEVRDKKRLVIGGCFLLLFVVVGYVIYVIVRPPATCSDGKKNQNETGIDCGGVCGACMVPVVGKDLISKEVVLVPSRNGTYDVVARIYNPNDTIGASEFRYVFTLKDVSGSIVGSASGKAFILPQETKYLVAFNVATNASPAQVGLSTDSFLWRTFTGSAERPKIRISNERYERTNSGAEFGVASGLVVNESPYDFRSMMVKVILRDESGKVLASNATEMRTMKSGERREFRLPWPQSFPGTVSSVEVEADADVYRIENFIKRYSPGSGF